MVITVPTRNAQPRDGSSWKSKEQTRLLLYRSFVPEFDSIKGPRQSSGEGVRYSGRSLAVHVGCWPCSPSSLAGGSCDRSSCSRSFRQSRTLSLRSSVAILLFVVPVDHEHREFFLNWSDAARPVRDHPVVVSRVLTGEQISGRGLDMVIAQGLAGIAGVSILVLVLIIAAVVVVQSFGVWAVMRALISRRMRLVGLLAGDL